MNAAFAFGGTELVGLAAAEASDPRKSLPTATKQVFWRITGFYVISLFMVGLILPSDDPNLLGSSGSDTKASPFVLAIQMAGVSGLPSVFNAVITISVLSVANSCTFGSTRTMQALAARGMGPKFLMYIDSKGRPLWCIIIQLVFGLLAFVNEATAGSTFFAWLLSLSGLSYFFVWGSICLSHIRFRRGWQVQGHTLDELPFQAQFGVIGSYVGFFLNCIALVATFYVSVWVSRFSTMRTPSDGYTNISQSPSVPPQPPLPSSKSISPRPLSSPSTFSGRSTLETRVGSSSGHTRWIY